MFRKLRLPLGIVAAGITVIFLLATMKPQPQPQPAASEPTLVKVSVIPASPQSVRLPVTAHGSVMPKREIDLVAQVAGQIVSVDHDFVDGGFFSSSELLVQIDDREYQADLLAAKAHLAEARQLLAEEQGRSRQAQKEWRDLGNDIANDLFLRKPHLAAAQANLDSARGEVGRAALNLEHTKISLPFDGRIRATHADLGQFVTVGTRIATVYDSTAVEIRLPLTEKQASLIDLPLRDSQQQVELPVVTVKGSVAGIEHEWQGELTRTDAFVDAQSRMYYAIVEVKDPFRDVPLLPGLFVEADIQGKLLEQVTILPPTSLYQREKILVLDDDNKTIVKESNVLHKTADTIWVQADIDNETLVTVEKQSLTPTGTLVDPVLTEAAMEDINVSALAE